MCVPCKCEMSRGGVRSAWLTCPGYSETIQQQLRRAAIPTLSAESLMGPALAKTLLRRVDRMTATSPSGGDGGNAVEALASRPLSSKSSSSLVLESVDAWWVCTPRVPVAATIGCVGARFVSAAALAGGVALDGSTICAEDGCATTYVGVAGEVAAACAAAATCAMAMARVPGHSCRWVGQSFTWHSRVQYKRTEQLGHLPRLCLPHTAHPVVAPVVLSAIAPELVSEC